MALHSNRPSLRRDSVWGGKLKVTFPSFFFFLGVNPDFWGDPKVESNSASLPRYTSIDESLSEPIMLSGSVLSGVLVFAFSSSEDMSRTKE